MKKYSKILLVCIMIMLLLLVGCNQLGADYNAETNGITYYLEQEAGIDSEGNLVYKIVYSYDENGNEVERIAYDKYGEEENWLWYAYDQMGIKENMYIDPTEVGEDKYLYMTDFTCELIYNQDGCLVKLIPSDSTRYRGISVIEYSYIDISDNMVNSEGLYEDGMEEADQEMSLEEKIINSSGVINVNGEQCYAIWGETGALVWKYVGATFEDDEHFLYAMAKDINEVETSEAGAEEWDAYRYTEWSALYDFQYFDFYHVGDDVFAMKFTHLCYIDGYLGYKERERFVYINGNAQTVFYDYRILPDERDWFDRITEFNDGYAICQYNNYAVSFDDTYLAVMDEMGNITITELEVYDYFDTIEEIPCGSYSDGLFYYYYAFYDIEFNKVVDISGQDIGRPYVNQGIYTPQFVDGVCTLITEKNGLYWIFDINMDGEIISEIEEFDIMSLNM